MDRPPQATLSRADLAADPVEQFRAWLNAASEAGLEEPNAATLATASDAGRPSARMVLLKSFDARGFVFATNYRSRKGLELLANPWAAMVFYWNVLDRQVRLEGAVEPTAADESDDLWSARPLASRLCSSISEQSAVVPDRAHLDEALRRANRSSGMGGPRPEHWGGFRIVPDVIEFWQGRPHRLHDRLAYRAQPSGAWRIDRLAP